MLYYVRLLAEEEKRTGREEQKTHPRVFFFEPRKLASKSAFEAHHASILFANGGSAPRPPPTPPAFFGRAGLRPPPPLRCNLGVYPLAGRTGTQAHRSLFSYRRHSCSQYSARNLEQQA